MNSSRSTKRRRPVRQLDGWHSARGLLVREEQYRSLFERNPSPMWICDESSLEILDANQAAEKLYGWSRAELLKMTVVDLRPPGEVPALVTRPADLRNSRAASVSHGRHWKRDRTVFDAEVTVSCIPYAGRMALLASVNDVTERKRWAEELNTSEKRYRSLFEHDLTGDFIATPDGTILLCNPAFATIFGFPNPKAAVGENLSGLVNAQKSWRELVKLLTRGKRIIRHECAALRCDGTPLHVIETLVGAFNDRGELVEIQGYVLDDTERKQAESDLKEFNATLELRVAERTAELTDAHDRLRAITDSTLIGMVTLNERGCIEALNPAAAAIFGYSADEIVGRTINHLLVSPDLAHRRYFWGNRELIGERQVLGNREEVVGRCKDGRKIMLELSVSEFSIRGQRQFAVMVRDITVRKQLERELLEISERERQRIGRDLHDGLGQQLHGLSYLATLLQRGLEEEASPRAAEVAQLNKYLAEALEQTRGLAHGLQPVRPLPQGLMIALRELATRTGKLYRVDCRFECHRAVFVERQSTATHLYRIAQEAVNNAMKHGKPSRVDIALMATRKLITLVIRDNGVGLRRRTKRSQGMGLRMMQYRADAMGGSLAVRNQARGGTEVICTIKRYAVLSTGDNS